MNKLVKYSIYALVFLMPLMFLPWTAEVLEFPKQMILVVLTATALIGWIGKMVVEKKLNLRVSVLDLTVFIFLGIWAVASLASQSPYGSLVGIGGSVADSFMSVLCFGALYFVIVNNIRNRHETEPETDTKSLSVGGITSVFLISAGVTLVIGILKMLGVPVFPWAFTASRGFNTVGTLGSLGIFAGMVLAGLALRGQTHRSAPTYVLALLALITLIFINFWTLWLGLALIMGFVLFLSIAFPKMFENKSLTLVMAVVLVALIFLFVRTPLINLNLPPEVSLSQQASMEITSQALREHPLLGSGPNTFGFDYSKWHSPDLNQTIFWNVRFNQASSGFIGLLATTGILGTIGLILMVGGLLWMVIKRTSANQGDLGLGDEGILIPFLFLLLIIFLYSLNLTLTFFFFLFFALAAGVMIERKGVRLNFAYSPRASQVLVFISLVLILLIASGLWFEAKRAAAQVYFKKAIVVSAQEGNPQQVRTLMVRAVNLDNRQDLLWNNLSQALLLEVGEKVNQQAEPQEIQGLIASTIRAARRATELAPENVANWQARGRVYMNLIGLGVEKSEDWAEDSYKKAISLEPNNPYLYTQLGRIYLAIGEEEKSYQAIKQFEKAIELKGDYSPAHFQIALAYERVGDLDKAIKKMESNKQYTPNDIGLRFQLGLMYYKKDNFELARAEFSKAIDLNPQHSNSRYFLGLIYDKTGETAKAIEQFEEIERFNPENQEIKTILSNLRAGKSAFGVTEAPGPEELPVEQVPEEVPASPGL